MDEAERRQYQRDIKRQLNPWTRRRVGAWSLFAVAFFVATQHWSAHMGFRPLPFSMGWQDIFLGYPMAIVIGILAAFVLEARPSGR